MTEAEQSVGLVGVASYLPERVVTNDFFSAGAAARRGMFTAPTTRRHVRPDQSATDMIAQASARLFERLSLDPVRDVDILFTNVAVPDEAFTGCGAAVAARLGCRPRWIIDLHNTGCVAFIYMMDLARALLGAHGARGALLCTVQNAAGRVFSDPEVRTRSQAPVPGDGCGVGYLALGRGAPIVSLVQHCQPEFATDMHASADDGRRYWEPGPSPLCIRFDEARVASIIERGNSIVPRVILEACQQAGVRARDLDLLVINQPNPIFLRNWREALELPRAVHHDTFDKYGNLFGAGIPINLEDALAQGKLAHGGLLALAGFSHAADYTAATILRWCAT
jgi:3-oxoacyl-[acyl-carrier-protein] synthase III